MTKMTRYLQLEDGHKIHKNTKEMREVKKELMFHRLLTILFATALILSGVTYDLTSNSLEYQGLMIANVMDDFENIQMILDLTIDRYDELLKVIQLAKYDSGIDSNVTGNSTDRILEKYSPERRQKMNHELRFISPRKIYVLTGFDQRCIRNGVIEWYSECQSAWKAYKKMDVSTTFDVELNNDRPKGCYIQQSNMSSGVYWNIGKDGDCKNCESIKKICKFEW